MYFQSDINKMFCYLDEETRNSIIDIARRDGKAILYYNSALNVLNVTNNDECEKLSEIILIAKITEKDLEFADTNREEINKMSNEDLGCFMVERVLNDKSSICEYLKQRSEISTYNLAKITKVDLDKDGLIMYTSEVATDSVEIGSIISIAPINGNRYNAYVVDGKMSENKPNSDKEQLVLRFFDDNVQIGVIPKLVGLGIKLSPKPINATTTSPAKGGNVGTNLDHILGKGMIERRKNGGFIHI